MLIFFNIADLKTELTAAALGDEGVTICNACVKNGLTAARTQMASISIAIQPKKHKSKMTVNAGLANSEIDLDVLNFGSM